MSKIKWLGAGAALALLLAVVAIGFSRPDPAYSQGSGFVIVSNTSGRSLPVISGVTGQPVNFGGQPWLIHPNETFYTHAWQGQPRFTYGGRAYHYLGSVPGTQFQFFLLEDWIVNAGGQIPPGWNPVVAPTPIPAATATPAPTTPFVQSGGVSYLPNCGLTQAKGRIVNPDGVGRPGVRVRVSTPGWEAISNPSDSEGHWDVFLDSHPKAGVWQVQVWDNGGQSPVVTVETNTHDCGPTGTGRQVAVVDFRSLTY